MGECWNHRTATFMILGNVCTRRCGFCAVEKGAPLPVDYDEPQRVAAAVEAMGLKFAVVTSVNRDDTETVPRLYRQVRLGARYERSLDVLAHARRVAPATPTKSGLMLGLGDRAWELAQRHRKGRMRYV